MLFFITAKTQKMGKKKNQTNAACILADSTQLRDLTEYKRIYYYALTFKLITLGLSKDAKIRILISECDIWILLDNRIDIDGKIGSNMHVN